MFFESVRAVCNFFAEMMVFSEFASRFDDFLYMWIMPMHLLHDGLCLSNELPDGFNILSSASDSSVLLHDPFLFSFDVTEEQVGLVRIGQFSFALFDQRSQAAVAFYNLVLETSLRYVDTLNSQNKLPCAK